ncbi:MAG: hypothetical protein KF812_01305 [Fimbriimonadaceae bacterium]|nr:hypothetical protein [Fimbriimonadaceae bacterium]
MNDRPPTSVACIRCGWTIDRFEEEGLVGCESCYESLGPELVTALKRPDHQNSDGKALQASPQPTDLVS